MPTGTIATQAMPDTHVAGRPFEQRGRREQADRRDGADDEIAGRRAQPDEEDADHAQEDRHLRAVEQAPAEDRVEQEEQVDGEQARQRRAPREGQRHRGEQREDERDGADAGVVDERRLGELREREERAASAASARSGSSARRETFVQATAAHPRGR